MLKLSIVHRKKKKSINSKKTLFSYSVRNSTNNTINTCAQSYERVILNGFDVIYDTNVIFMGI